MLATLIHRYDKKSFHFKKERITEILQAVRCNILWIVLIPYINLSNLSWIIKCPFFRNMEPLILLLLLLLIIIIIKRTNIFNVNML